MEHTTCTEKPNLASAANVLVGNSTNGQSVNIESPTAKINFDGTSTLSVNADTTFLQGNVHFGDMTSGQDVFVWATGSTNPSVRFDKATGTLSVTKAQTVANSTGALVVDGPTMLGNATTGSDVKIMGNAWLTSSYHGIHRTVSSLSTRPHSHTERLSTETSRSTRRDFPLRFW